MTDSRTLWLKAQDRKRTLRSLGIVLAAYAVAFLISLLIGLFIVHDVAEFSGPVMVRLGKLEGEDVRRANEAPVLDTIPETPAPETPSDSVPVTETTSAAPQSASAPKAAPTAQPKTPAAPSKTAPAVPATTSSQAVSPPPPPKPVVIRGSDSGNTYDLSFEAGAGDVGRSFYVPIWVYMPVPYEVSDEIYKAIPDQKGLPGTAEQRKATFARFYVNSGTGRWTLKGGRSPVYDARPEIWVMLEEAGYPVDSADYKADRSLKPVSILFRVSPYRPASGVVLEDVLVEISSGYSDIDEAVLYAFSQAKFRNDGKTSISGRFTYTF
ncbi:MAG: hypothetical protein E4H20_03330 [Spirochaetales bacterium]|nr:MAG: hypothetical protein E4H20_03330 [Spirochaetales bacterium]